MERAVIIALFSSSESEDDIKDIINEMKMLSQTAGAEISEVFVQKRDKPDKRYMIGKGKVDEIKNYAYANDIETIIVFNNLNNIQQRNLENFFKLKVIDRTRLILDIFATRARSLEGKLQVELAQLLYLLPRLIGKGSELSRLGGGIGTRGPGETKLEVDRRTIKKRISIVKKKLKTVIKNREVQRKNRIQLPVPVVSLVGYTSAGKSTLFRRLTGEDVLISKKLFSTLDPVLRRVDLSEIEEGFYFLLSDTVGFIRNIPGELITSFKATLEEVIKSDIILLIVDISSPLYLKRIKMVESVLNELGIDYDKIIYVYNKVDLVQGFSMDNLNHNKKVYVSAIRGDGIGELKKIIFNRYFKEYRRFEIVVKKNDYNEKTLKRWAIIRGIEDKGDKIKLDILSNKEKVVKFINSLKENKNET